MQEPLEGDKVLPVVRRGDLAKLDGAVVGEIAAA